MTFSWDPKQFLNLTGGNHVEKSPVANRYNCIGWAASSDRRWWWPTGKGYWPPTVPREETMDAFILAYGTQGYIACNDGSLEAGFEKVIIYAISRPNGTLDPQHAARQLPDGRWTSKMGPCEDIEHDTPEVLAGPYYGDPVRYLRRPVQPPATVVPDRARTKRRQRAKAARVARKRSRRTRSRAIIGATLSGY
jgi:hypothetical protein